MISLGCAAPKISFQFDNPGGFDELLAEVKKHVSEEDVDAERQTGSSTPGGPDSKQLAFQVQLITLLLSATASLMAGSTKQNLGDVWSFLHAGCQTNNARELIKYIW